ANIALAFQKNELITVEKLCDQLEALSAESYGGKK
ncbi:MAG: hypothetical protein K0Q48_3414, partial [Bacillota bacterium]|nr:hypothetical protein [Bacillota bacterium]